jgi:hypothetical protein
MTSRPRLTRYGDKNERGRISATEISRTTHLSNSVDDNVTKNSHVGKPAQNGPEK